MNNHQFRKLLLDTPARKSNDDDATNPSATTKRSSLVPMTPRAQSGAGNLDFARQVRERHAALQPSKKFKSSAPKGSKLGAGYVDRAKARAEGGEGTDDRAERIKALEEQVKLGQLSREIFESLRDEITGGDISSTHLVKGLDRRLLERVRRGEDVFKEGGETEEGGSPPDVDDALDELEEQDIQSIQREKVQKKGVMAPPPVAGVKRTRDEIMAELKAQRKAAAEAKAAAAASQFDGRWRKVGQKEKLKIEIDHKGREVLTTVDENGKIKKKIRKIAVEGKTDITPDSRLPDASKPILGADAFIPDIPKPVTEANDDDDDIFAGVGTEYNPLGNEEEEDDDDEDEDNVNDKSNDTKVNEVHEDIPDTTKEESSTPTPSQIATAPRNYFGNTVASSETEPQNHFKDIENVLKKVAKIGNDIEVEDDDGDGESKAEKDARLAKRAKMLDQRDRDMEDMDFGFGSSRFADEDEGEDGTEKKPRLSKWNNDNDEDDGGWEEGGKDAKKKRKPKKRKGDVNNAADIMRVIENRKAAQG